MDKIEKKPENTWFNIVRTVLSMPGARVNRDQFLKDNLRPHVSEDVISHAIDTSPSKAKIDSNVIDRIANGCINYHVSICTSTSFATGLPGGWWAAGTIPADITQYFYHTVIVCQKLLYLYGWPDLFEEDDFGNVDEETLLKITLFLGVMMGATGANKAVTQLAQEFAKEVVKRLPKQALTKYAVYNISKQIAKWIGIKLTKETFAKQIGKFIPVIGGVIAGSITFLTLKPMSKRLQHHLKELPLHKTQ
jgi:hypothetical protein